MIKYKRFKQKIKVFVSSIVWKIRNVYNSIKTKITSSIKKQVTKTKLYKSKQEKKLKNEQLVLEYANTNPVKYMDGKYVLNDVIRNDLDVEFKSLKENPNPELKKKLITIDKALPITKKKQERKEKIVSETKKILKALLYLSPVIILLSIFSFYPIINSFRLAFIDVNGYNSATGEFTSYTFLGNFSHVLKDANFIIPSANTGSSAMINTLVIVIISVPLSIIISLLIAVALSSIKPLRSFFQTIFFLPYVTNALAVGLVFAYIFQKDGGLFNKFLQTMSIDGGAWVGVGASYTKAMFVLLLFSIWNGLAFKIMVFLSAIQSIDKQYYQAASIDATPRFRQFRKITVPLISPSIFYIVITSVIGSFKTYSSVLAIFGQTGQPAGADYTLKTIVFYIYDFFNTPGQMPRAAAASIILFGIILILTIIQLQVGKKKVHY